jgi:putative ABC transport system ATP-binding protein
VLEAGDCVAITGPSGCGKSTVLGLLALALRPASAPGAAFSIGGADALSLWHRGDDRGLARLRAQTLGFVPQTSALLAFLSLRENIALPQAIAGRPDPGYFADIAASLGIAHVLARRPAEVSVGQRQRAAIARAMAHLPPLIQADEPTASVHPTQAEEILALLHRLAVETGTALLMVTHDRPRAEAAGFAIAPYAPSGLTSRRFVWTGR